MDAEPEGEKWRIGHVTHVGFSSDAIVQGVVLLRNSVTEVSGLKPLSSDQIREKIHEFYVVIMEGEFVGCFRIFHPPSLGKRALELGSVVSNKRGVGKTIAENAENIAREVGLPIVAVTRGRFEGILQRRGWEIRSSKYKKRRRESCKSKRLLEFIPKV